MCLIKNISRCKKKEKKKKIKNLGFDRNKFALSYIILNKKIKNIILFPNEHFFPLIA